MEYYLYIISNNDWIVNGNKYKYGIVEIKKGKDIKENLIDDIYEFIDYNSSLHTYISIYRLEKNKTYDFYKNPIDIIFNLWKTT